MVTFSIVSPKMLVGAGLQPLPCAQSASISDSLKAWPQTTAWWPPREDDFVLATLGTPFISTQKGLKT